MSGRGASAERMRRVVEAIGRRRFRFTVERELQDGIEQVLRQEFGEEVQREHAIGVHDRPDFMVGAVAVEVKIRSSLHDLLRQVGRYAEHDGVGGVVVVTPARHLGRMPATIGGKNVAVAVVRSWL